MNTIVDKINSLSDRTVLKMVTSMLAINTGFLIDATLEIHKLHRIIKQWQTNHKYMMKINEGLNHIASNPKSDPLENRAAINKLLDDVNAEILLDQVDFSGIEKQLNQKDENE